MVSITRLSGGNTPADGGDPRTFPAIWNSTATSLESALAEAPVTVSATAPSSPVNGDLWWDTVNEGLFMYYTGVDPAEWIVAGGGGGASVTISSTAPAGPAAGDMWWDSDNGNLYIYYDDGTSQQWVAGNGPQVFVGTSAPAGYQGQLWFDSTTGKVYIYYDDGTSAQWVSAIGGSLAGSVLQVVSTTKTDTFASTSTTLEDVTGLSASITPRSASSKILVIVSLALGSQAGTVSSFAALLRDSTQIFLGDAASNRRRVSINTAEGGDGWIQSNMTHLDSPASTSALTYKVQVCGNNTSGIYVNRGRNDGDSALWGRGASSITLMEVAG